MNNPSAEISRTERLKRWIRTWLGVSRDNSYPHRFVSLVYWRDGLVGVDGNGDIYDLKTDYQGLLVIQLVTRNPLEGGRHGR